MNPRSPFILAALASLLAGCGSTPPSSNSRTAGTPPPSLTGELAGWRVFWLGKDRITFDHFMDVGYDLKRVNGRWTVVDDGRLADPEVERIRLDVEGKRIILLAQATQSTGPSSGQSLCSFGVAADKSKTDRGLGYTHCMAGDNYLERSTTTILTG